MDKVLMIYGGEYYYWKPVILAIAALAAAVLAIGLRIWRGERVLPLAAALPVGTVLELYGRLQSRCYIKVLDDRREERTAYELSVMEAYRADF